MRDVEMLRSRNLGLGGSLDNAIVLDDYRVLNHEGLRYGDEFIRHKILDAIAICTPWVRYCYYYQVDKSGYAINNLLVRACFSSRMRGQWSQWQKIMPTSDLR